MVDEPDDTRPLYRPGRETPPDGDAMPRGGGKAATETRQMFQDYLGAHMSRPVHFSDSQQMARVDEQLRTMTMAERIMIELELHEKLRTAYSSDYDPLRY